MATPDPNPRHLRGEVRPPAKSPLENQRVAVVTGWLLLACAGLIVLGTTATILAVLYAFARGALGG
jgi:hypothetical protein